VACETARPGGTTVAAATTTTNTTIGETASSSIGIGGCSFEGTSDQTTSTTLTSTSTSAIGAGGFSFGGSSATAAATTPAFGNNGTEGFSFGGETNTNTNPTSSNSGGFSFGGQTTNTNLTSISSSGFSFGGGGTNTPSKEERTDKHKAIDEERQLTDTEKTASRVFDEFDSSTHSSGSIPISFFEEMSDALGEGFYGEEYETQVNVVDPTHTGIITRSAFLAWYTVLVEGGSNNNEDGSLDTADREERAEEEEKATNMRCLEQ